MASEALRKLSIDLAKKSGTGTGSSTGSTGAPSIDYRTLDTGTMDGGGASSLDKNISSALTSYSKTLGSGPDTKTIMEKFSERAKLTREGGKAERSLISSNASDDISAQLDDNARAWTDASEGRSGFATQTAAVQYLEKSGSKRVLDLEKQRDALILQSKIGEASRLDTLIGEEQTAITEARKSWLESLFSLSGESRAQSEEKRAQAGELRARAEEERAARGFETPEEARTRDLVAGEAQARMEGVRSLASIAPDAGILSTDSYDTAITKYRNSSTYKRDQRKGELEIQKMEADIANTRSLTTTRDTGGSGNAGSTTTDGVYSSDLDFMIDIAAGKISSKFGQKQFYDTVAKARNDADKITAIASTVLANAPAEVKNDFNSQANAIASLDKAIAMIDSGVKTGVYNNATQYLYNVVGKDFDPKLAQINQYITSAIQPYRSSITGAAWGQQEDGEYQQLFGSTKYSPAELKQRLQGIKEIMLGKTATAISSQVNPLGTLQDVVTPQVNSGYNMSVAPSSMFNDSDL